MTFVLLAKLRPTAWSPEGKPCWLLELLLIKTRNDR
jgi:hypothetical protein